MKTLYESILDIDDNIDKFDNNLISDFQKIFWSISFGFIITCIFWYGGRFIYLYLENDKKLEVTKNVLTLSNSIKDQYFNTESLKQVKEDYYLHGNDINNYVSYLI